MKINQSFIDSDIRYLLIDLFYPQIKASDFLSEEYDEAIKGISYRPDTGHKINYNYSTLVNIINSKTPIEEITNLMKDKPNTEVSTDFKNIPEDKSEEEEEEEYIEESFLSEEMEKIASEELHPSSNCVNGKTFISEDSTNA